jgi:site-specific recombinase XerD
MARYLAQYPDMRGKALRVKRSNFYLKFRELATACGIPLDLTHPHVLRHTRTIELVRAGVPLTIVQQMLGHSVLNTTAILFYLPGPR